MARGTTKAITATTLIGLMAGVAAARSQGDYEWSGKSGISWLDTGNWLVRGAPASDPPGIGSTIGVDVLVADPRGRTIRVNGPGVIELGSFTAVTPVTLENRLVLNAESLLTDLQMNFGLAVLEANAATTLDGDTVWQNGGIDGLAPVTNTGLVTILGSVPRFIDTAFINQGTFSVVNAVSITLGPDLPASTFTNAGLLFGRGSIGRASGSPARLVNSGTVRSSGGALTIGVPVDAVSGLFDPTVGTTLSLSRGMSVTGAVTVGGDGNVVLNGQPGTDPYEVLGALTVTGLGDVLLTSDLLVAAGGSVIVDNSPASAEGLAIDATVDLDGTITVDGIATLAGAELIGTGSLVVGPIGQLTTRLVSGTRTVDLDGGMQVNGVFRHRAGTLSLVGPTLLEITTNGTLDLDRGTIAGGALRLDGRLRRRADTSVGTGAVTSLLAVAGGSLIENDFQTLRLDGGGIWSGGRIATGPTALTSMSGTHGIDGPVQADGDGTLTIASAGTLLIGEGGSFTVDMPGGLDGLGWLLDGGELSLLGGLARNEGAAIWRGGEIRGTSGGQFVNAAGATMVVDGFGATLGVPLRHEGDAFRLEETLTLDFDGILTVADATLDVVDGGIGLTPSSDGIVELASGGVLRRPADAVGTIETVAAPVHIVADARIETVGGDLRLSRLLQVDAATLTLDAGPGTELRLAGGIAGGEGAGDPFVSGLGAGTLRLESGTMDGVSLSTAGPTVLDGMDLGDGSAWFAFAPASWRAGDVWGSDDGLEGARIFVDTDEFVIDGAGARALDGRMTVLAGANVFHDEGAVELDGLIDVKPGGAWFPSGGSSVTSASGNGFFINDGLVSKTGSGSASIAAAYAIGDTASAETRVVEGTLTLADVETIDAEGRLTAGRWIVEAAGTLVVPGPIVTIGSGVSVRVADDVGVRFPALIGLERVEGELVAAGTLPGPIVHLGQLSLDGGDLEVTEGITLERDQFQSVIGDVQGVIALADGPVPASRIVTSVLRNTSGRVVPGGLGTPGTVAITGDLEMLAGGTTVLDMGAAASDVLDIDGAVQLGGTLRLDALSDWMPPVGTQVTVLTATGPITGAFGDVLSPDLGTWSVAIAGQTVVATLIAEPTCGSDIDGSGDVGLSDLLQVLVDWGFCPSCAADLDGNDDVGLEDLIGVLANWGPCAG